MTQITFQDGKILMRDGKVGTGQGCCCNQTPCTCGNCSSYTLKIGGVCVAQGVMNPIIDAPYFDETLNPFRTCTEGDLFAGDGPCEVTGDQGTHLPFCFASDYGDSVCSSTLCEWLTDTVNFSWPFASYTGPGNNWGGKWWPYFVFIKRFGECDAGGQFLLDGLESYVCTGTYPPLTGSPTVEGGIRALPCYCCDGTTIRVRVYYIHDFLYTYPWVSTPLCFRYRWLIGNVYYRDYEGPLPACGGEVDIPPVGDFVLVDITDKCPGTVGNAEGQLPIWSVGSALNAYLSFPDQATEQGVAGSCECDIGPLTLSCGPLPECLQEFP